LARASFSAPPLDRFKIAAWLALPSVAKTADLGVAIDSALIAAFAAFAAFKTDGFLRREGWLKSGYKNISGRSQKLD
jgi:hypothetical protein